MTRAPWFVLAVFVGLMGGLLVGWSAYRTERERRDGAALLVRAPDGRCWRAHSRVEYVLNDRALSWRTDGGTTIHVHAADWIEVVRGSGANAALDWRGSAAVLGVDLSRCLPAEEIAP